MFKHHHRGQRFPPPFIRRCMPSRQSAAYGGKSASEANQEWKRRYSNCKHAMWSTISSAVRNLMIKTDRMLSAFQPAALEIFICGWWREDGGAFSFREGTSAQISFYLHHLNFFFTFMLHVQICSKTMLTCNFPTREKEKKTKHVLMFNANHKISRWVFTGKIQSFLFIFCSLLFLKLVS